VEGLFPQHPSFSHHHHGEILVMRRSQLFLILTITGINSKKLNKYLGDIEMRNFSRWITIAGFPLFLSSFVNATDEVLSTEDNQGLGGSQRQLSLKDEQVTLSYLYKQLVNKAQGEPNAETLCKFKKDSSEWINAPNAYERGLTQLASSPPLWMLNLLTSSYLLTQIAKAQYTYGGGSPTDCNESGKKLPYIAFFTYYPLKEVVGFPLTPYGYLSLFFERLDLDNNQLIRDVMKSKLFEALYNVTNSPYQDLVGTVLGENPTDILRDLLKISGIDLADPYGRIIEAAVKKDNGAIQGELLKIFGIDPGSPYGQLIQATIEQNNAAIQRVFVEEIPAAPK
jgi:hypothetical protein